MDQREYIAQFIKDDRMKMNPVLFERSDQEIIDQLKKVILSCERQNAYFGIKVLGFTVVDDYAKINKILADYYDNMTKNKSIAKRKDNQYSFINLNDSAIQLLIVHYLLSDSRKEQQLDVIIEVPRIVDKYYFKINGIMRSTLYQIVDGSTYNNSTSNSKSPNITFKIVFMAVRVSKFYMDMNETDEIHTDDIVSTEGKTIRAVNYVSRMFNKSVNALKYILARYGFYGMLDFMGLRYIFVDDHDPHTPGYYTFCKPGTNIYISTPRQLFDNDNVTQSVICALYRSSIPGMDYEMFFTPEFWVRSLGADFNNVDDEKMLEIIKYPDCDVPDTIDKGYSVLDSFDSIYDIGTRESIRLPYEDKKNMYCILRWILREFNYLRLKDNLDITIKKIRFADYIASLYAMKIVRGIYRIADMGKRASVDSLVKAIRTTPTYLLGAVCKCGMITYRNMVSDMDSMQALKFTYKGISGLGENSNEAIPNIYRYVQPSHIGKVDLDGSSDGNPGITGTISPFVKLYDGYFSDYQEPNFWKQEYDAMIDDYRKVVGLQEALIFQERILDKEVSEELRVANEVLATMQQLINPLIFDNPSKGVD